MPEPPADDRDKPSPDWKRPPEPPIHRAARKGDIEALAYLLNNGADINTRADIEFDNGSLLKDLTTLMVAARSIDGATVETLRWLVDHGADIHARSAGDCTAAWYAAGHGGRWEFHQKATTPDHADRLRYLLDNGADPNDCSSNGRSLLTEASRAGDPVRVRLLLEYGASPAGSGNSTRDSPSRNGFAVADHDNDTTRVDDVFSGNPHSFEIPIFCAAESGCSECVQLLLDAGADPNTRDSSNATPLMYAGSPEVARILLTAGADLQAVDESDADVLQAMLEDRCDVGVCAHDRLATARILIEAGSDIHRINESGWSRLDSAAFRRNADAVEFLISMGAKVDSRDCNGSSPLHKICWQGELDDSETNQACEKIIRMLVSSGAPIDATDDGLNTPLHEAADGDWGNQTAIRTLLELGADPNPVNTEGDTPLILAAERAEVECIKALLEAGADPMLKNNSGKTALEKAKAYLEPQERAPECGSGSCLADDSFDPTIQRMLAHREINEMISESRKTAIQQARMAIAVLERAMQSRLDGDGSHTAI